jgi:hypothetical protein
MATKQSISIVLRASVDCVASLAMTKGVDGRNKSGHDD